MCERGRDACLCLEADAGAHFRGAGCLSFSRQFLCGTRLERATLERNGGQRFQIFKFLRLAFVSRNRDPVIHTVYYACITETYSRMGRFFAQSSQIKLMNWQ